jgi:hypothetical protein
MEAHKGKFSRKTLDWKSKLDIIELIESGQSKAIAISQKYGISKSAVSGLMKDKEKYKKAFISHPSNLKHLKSK